jgi:hypothetical protein
MHVLNAAASNICGFHWRETCILSPWLNRPVWNNRVYPPRKHTVQEVFLSKLSQFLKRNNVLDSLFLTQMVFFGEIHIFPQVSWIRLFQTETISTLKNLTCRKTTFQKLTTFTEGNNVIDTSDSNTDGFLQRYTCVSSTKLNRPIWNKMNLSPTWQLWFAGSIPFKNQLSSHRETMC